VRIDPIDLSRLTTSDQAWVSQRRDSDRGGWRWL